MFSWICPKCGSEVPPSYNECPNCTATAVAPPPGQASTRPAAPPPPPPPPQARAPWPQQQQPPYQQPAPPPQESRRPPKPAGVLFGPGGGDYDPASAPPPPNYPPPPQQQYQNYPPQGFVPQQSYTPPPPPAYAPPPQAQPSYTPPPQSSGMPSWMLMLLVALVVGGVVAGAVWLKRRSADSTEAVAHEGAPVTGESAPSAASAGHRYAKFVELSGFRISEDAKQRANVKLAITNHSTADIGDIEMLVTLKTTDGRDLGTATMKANGLGPLTTAEVTAPLKTKLRAYELPDWQFVKAEFQITSQ